MEPTIVAMGGGSLSEERSAQLIEGYVLGLTGKDDPRVCFLGTATGDNPIHIVRFYEVFSSDRCRPSHLTLIDRKVDDLRGFLLSQDAIFIGGGNTAAMLAIWRQHEVDAILREAWQGGIVMCGSSAGGLCWFECGVTDSFGRQLAPLQDGLGFVGGSFCPHYDAEVRRRPVYQQAIATGALPAGLAADNCVGLHYEGTSLREIVSSAPAARAWRLSKTETGFREEEIVPRYLGAG